MQLKYFFKYLKTDFCYLMLYEHNNHFIGSCTLSYFRLYLYLTVTMRLISLPLKHHEWTILKGNNFAQRIHGMGNKIVNRDQCRLRDTSTKVNKWTLFTYRFKAITFLDEWGNSRKDEIRVDTKKQSILLGVMISVFVRKCQHVYGCTLKK